MIVKTKTKYIRGTFVAFLYNLCEIQVLLDHPEWKEEMELFDDWHYWESANEFFRQIN